MKKKDKNHKGQAATRDVLLVMVKYSRPDGGGGPEGDRWWRAGGKEEKKNWKMNDFSKTLDELRQGRDLTYYDRLDEGDDGEETWRVSLCLLTW